MRSECPSSRAGAGASAGSATAAQCSARPIYVFERGQRVHAFLVEVMALHHPRHHPREHRQQQQHGERCDPEDANRDVEHGGQDDDRTDLEQRAGGGLLTFDLC